MPDQSARIAEQIAAARAAHSALKLVGGDSKPHFGREIDASRLDLGEHSGIVEHAPAELVLTARGGTRLADIEAALDETGQMLGFEPPRLGATATIGGTLACNLSGPRRPWAGSVRDAVLGVELITGKAERLRFGGRVMKNVAGFDVSRLQAGALGAFGVITEVSLKVLPKPATTLTLVKEMPAARAIVEMNERAAEPKPLSAAAWLDGRLYLRLAGAETAVMGAFRQWGGQRLDAAEEFWSNVREQALPFFDSDRPLFRFSVKPTAPLPALDGPWLIDWGGAQRFVHAEIELGQAAALAAAAGGHASLYRGGDRSGEVRQPLPAVLEALHVRLKSAFDPDRILNPGRLYSWL